jgi:hypothetical protein
MPTARAKKNTPDQAMTFFRILLDLDDMVKGMIAVRGKECKWIFAVCNLRFFVYNNLDAKRLALGPESPFVSGTPHRREDGASRAIFLERGLSASRHYFLMAFFIHRRGK